MNKHLRGAVAKVLAATMCLSLVCPAFAVDVTIVEGAAPVQGSSELTISVVDCEHGHTKWVDNGDGTHDKVCVECDEVLVDDQVHYDLNHDRVCDACHALMACTHPGWTATDNGDGTHKKTCTDCGETLVDKEAHKDENGDGHCDDCGSGDVACKHPDVDYTDNGDGTHTGHCKKCGKDVDVDEKHVDANGDCVCDKCGAACHDELRWIDNEDGETHDGVCERCHETVVDDERHEDGDNDGVCDKCGYNVSGGSYLLRAAIPTVLPIVANTNGNVTVPTNAVVTNLVEDRAIEVEELSVELDSAWTLVHGDTMFTKSDLDAKLLALGFRKTPVEADGSVNLNRADWVIGAGDDLPLNMWARVPVQSRTSSEEGIGHVTFTLTWANPDDAATSVVTGYTLTVGSCDHGTCDVRSLRTDENGFVTELPEVTGVDPGYEFSGWTRTDEDGNVVSVSVGDRLTQDVVLNAVFKVRVGTTIDSTKMASVFGANGSKVKTVTFAEGNPADGVDVSARGDRSVLAVLDASAAAGVIYLNDAYLTSAEALFKGYVGLRSVDLSGLDTSHVTSMAEMFRGCSSLSSLDVSALDTGAVTNMYAMFCDCSSLTALDLSGWNTSGVVSMQSVFYRCSSLTSVDVSGWDTSNVTNMRAMFLNCSALLSLDLSGFDTSKVTGFYDMFHGCSSMVFLDVSGFDTGKVTDMAGMFFGCSVLSEVDVSGFDTCAVTDMYGMFSGCSGLKVLDLSGFDTSRVTNVSEMFKSCSSLKSVYVSTANQAKFKSASNTPSNVQFVVGSREQVAA